MLNTAKLAQFLKKETEGHPAWVYQNGYLYLANQANIFRTQETEKLEAWIPPEQEQAYLMPSRYNSFSSGRQEQVLRKEYSARYNPLAMWDELRTVFGETEQEQVIPSARMLDYGKGKALYRAFKRPNGEHVWLPQEIIAIFSSDLAELQDVFSFWYLPSRHCLHVFAKLYQGKRQAGIDMVAFCSIVSRMSDWQDS